MTATQRAATFVERQVATQYRKLLRTMKDVDLTTAPPDVQQAVLALHQNALAVWMEDRNARIS